MPTIAFPLAQPRGRDIDPCSHPAGASGHNTSAGAVPLVKKMTFLNEFTGSVVVWPRRCGTQADELRPVKRCGDLAAQRRRCPIRRRCHGGAMAKVAASRRQPSGSVRCQRAVKSEAVRPGRRISPGSNHRVWALYGHAQGSPYPQYHELRPCRR